MIGASVRRVEDRPLLLGKASFAGDIRLPGQLSMRVVRSPIAHGRLVSIDTREACAVPGVVGVFTAEEVDLPWIEFRQVAFAEMLPYRQPVLARDRVRYVGEPVAIVIAEDAYAAEDAEELVSVTIDELPAVVDPLAAPSDFDDANDTAALTFEFGYGESSDDLRAGERVVEIDVRIGRHSGIPMECRGAVADYDPATGILRFIGAAKVPHYNRDALASMLGMAPSRVILSEVHVGGGFGIRGELYPEDCLVAWASRRLQRPVGWIEDRREHFLAANHSRDQVHRLRAVVTDDGFIRALDDEFWLDQGAYVRTHAATVPQLTAAMLPGPYVIPTYRVKGHVRLTNKTPAGTYRAPGRYEGTFARERLIDRIAVELGMSAMDVRARNFIGVDQMPYHRPLFALGTAIEYDSGDYARLVSRADDSWDLATVEAEVTRRRAAGELVGLGRSFFVEKSGLGPYEGVTVAVDEAGLVEVTTGGASVGQGFETIIAQVCGDVLGVDVERVTVRHGQTNDYPYGMGAFASRLSVMAGTAAHMAATAVRDKAIAAFAHHREVAEGDVELRQGKVLVAGSPDTALTIGEVARLLRPVQAHQWSMEPGLSADRWFYANHMNYPYGYHVALISIDPEVFDVRVERYWVAYDVGRAINPTLVEGQIVGGAAQGLGGALLEEFRYDDGGQPLCTSFLDYLMPTAAEMPPVSVLITEDAPSPLNPLGLKGAGEGGTTGFGAAIASAVDAALGGWHVTHLPIGPSALRTWMGVEETT